MRKKIISLLLISVMVLFSISCSLVSKITDLVSSKHDDTVSEIATAALGELADMTETPDVYVTQDSESYQNSSFMFYDDFSSDQNGWAVGLYDGDYARTDYEFTDGKYVWDVYSYQLANVTSWPDMEEVTSFSVQVTAQQTSDNPDDCDYGLIYREPDGQSFISFTVSNADYSVYVYDAEAGWTELVPWTTDSMIFPGEQNVMQVTREGDDYTFSVNGQEMATFTYSDISSGTLGLNADIFPVGATGTFEFDDFLVTSTD